MKHVMTLRDTPFNQIELGIKTIEARLYDDKRKRVKSGDVIIFSKVSDTSKSLSTEVKEIYRFHTFAEMFNTLGVIVFGFPDDFSSSDASNAMRKYYSLEEELEKGVIGIHIIKS